MNRACEITEGISYKKSNLIYNFKMLFLTLACIIHAEDKRQK